MSLYSLAIDAGGTKTLGLLQCSKTGESWQTKDKGASLSHSVENAGATITSVIENLIDQSNSSMSEINAVCGAAGAGNKKARNQLLEILPKDFNNLLITTDARTSLYGAGHGSPVVVVAVGTGTVAMRLDVDGVEKQFGGWGFIAGDLGGGAYIGRELVTAALNHFDADLPEDSPLLDKVFDTLGSSKQQILNWIKTSTPTSFAEFAPIVFENYSNNEVAKNIINKSIKEVEQLILMARGESELPIVLLGGLSKVMKPLLTQQTQEIIIEAKGDALTGALYLADKL